MSERSRVAEFVSFCIEAFAREKHLLGSHVAQVFLKSGAIDYIDDGYDVLHTQGARWLVADLTDFLKARGVAA